MMKRIAHILRRKVRAAGRLITAHRAVTITILFFSCVGFVLPQFTEGVSIPGMGIITGMVGSVVGDIGGWAVGKVTFILGYLFAAIVGVFISAATYTINVVLQLNTHVMDAVAVQQGFKVTLSIANLGFVLAIIIIAIATIIRFESYGMKKILWKVIVAALLVNFSLVIAGSIINFSDQLSGSFIAAFPGQQGEGILGKGKELIFSKFASGLAGAFNPQRNWIFLTEKSSASGIGGLAGSSPNSNTQAASIGGQSIGKILVPLIQLSFTAVVSVFILFALLSLAVLLMIRYVYLGILLILMPLAWLLWIFPLTEKNWSKWWGKFMKWTFFAPITLFFLWLVILTSAAMSKEGSDPIQNLHALGYVPTGSEGFVADVSAFYGGFINEILGNFLQALILVALTVAGFFAAEALALETSKAATKIAGAANGYIARRMGHYGGRAMKPLKVQEGATAVQREGLRALRNANVFGTKIKSPAGQWANKWLNPINLSARVIGGVASVVPGGDLAARLMARGTQAGLAATGTRIVEEEAKRVKAETAGYTGAQRGSLLPTLNPDAQKALLEQMLKAGELKHAVWQDKLWDRNTKEEWERVGKGEIYDKLNEAHPVGHHKATIEQAAKVYEEAKKTARSNAEKTVAATFTKEELDKKPAKDKEALVAQETDLEMQKMQNNPNSPLNKDLEAIGKAVEGATEVPSLEQLQHTVEELLRVTKKNAKTVIGAFFGEKPVPGYSQAETRVVRRIYVTGLAEANPTMVPNIIVGMNFKEMEGFNTEYRSYLKSEIDRLARSGADPGRLQKFNKNLDNLERIIARQGFSTGPEEKEKEEGGEGDGRGREGEGSLGAGR